MLTLAIAMQALRTARPRKLNTIVLIAVSSVLTAIALVFSLLAHQYMAYQTLDTTRQSAQSIARIASQTNVNPFILNDLATMESGLAQLVSLPGVSNISLFRPDGRLLAWASAENGRTASGVGGVERLPSVGSVAGELGFVDGIQGDYYEAWQALNIGAPQMNGLVRVRLSLKERDANLQRLWIQSLIATAMLVGLVMLGLHLSLSRALSPIKDLSEFAEGMSDQVGRTLALESHCVEFNNLGNALSAASHSVASQIRHVGAILNTAADAVVGLDENGVIVTLNPAATSILGRQEYDMLSFHLSNFIPGLDTETLRSMFRDPADVITEVPAATLEPLDDLFDSLSGSASSQSGAAPQGERAERVTRTDFLGTRADGTPFPVSLSLGLVPNVPGLRYVCIIRDVTDENAFREFTELYERALSCTNNGVLISNAKAADFPVVFVNDAFQDIVPLQLYQLFSKPMQSILEMPLAQGDEETLSGTRFRNRYTTTTERFLQPGQPARTIEVSLSPVRDGKSEITHYVGILSDITDRIQTQAILAERKRQLDAIFSLSPDGFALFDGSRRMVFANPAFLHMTGLNWSNADTPLAIGEFEQFFSGITDTSFSLHTLSSSEGESEGDAARKRRLHLVRPQVRVLEAQLRQADGGQETILYIRDVTNEDAVDRMKSEFLASAAHELRTPMVSIFGFTELLLKRDYAVPRQKDMLGTIHRQSGLLVKMINELLDLARIESRRGLDLKIDNHSLLQLVTDSVNGLMRDEADRQVNVSEVPDLQVLIDPEKLQLALSNLLSNAFKYSPAGGPVRLSVRDDQWNGRGYAVVEVTDSGIGMTPAQLERAFERFYRADTSGNIPGTGLGLCLVKEIAELHKGKVALTSVAGEGTTASLWIPLVGVAPLSAPTVAVEPEPSPETRSARAESGDALITC